MNSPDTESDEKIIKSSENISVKTGVYKAFLTNRRVILADESGKRDPVSISVPLITRAEAGVNNRGEAILTLSAVSSGGDLRKMILSFPQDVGKSRYRERDEWVQALHSLRLRGDSGVAKTPVPSKETAKIREEPDDGFYTPVRARDIRKKARNISVKSMPFHIFLTDEYLVLADASGLRGSSSISLDQTEAAEAGVNESGEPTITLAVRSSGSDLRKMIFTFSEGAGDLRNSERDEWLEALNAAIPAKEAGDTYSAIQEVGEGPGAERPGGAKTHRAPPLAPAAFCRQCGTEILPEAHYCHVCGASTGDRSAPGVPSAPVQLPMDDLPAPTPYPRDPPKTTEPKTTGDEDTGDEEAVGRYPGGSPSLTPETQKSEMQKPARNLKPVVAVIAVVVILVVAAYALGFAGGLPQFPSLGTGGTGGGGGTSSVLTEPLNDYISAYNAKNIDTLYPLLSSDVQSKNSKPVVQETVSAFVGNGITFGSFTVLSEEIDGSTGVLEVNLVVINNGAEQTDSLSIPFVFEGGTWKLDTFL